MANSTDDTEVMVSLTAAPTQPGSIDPAVLRRALKYGQRALTRFPNRSFHELEADLQAGWRLRGETTDWDWVRAAVRAGYEQEPQDDV